MDFSRDQYEMFSVGGKMFHPAYTPEKMFQLGIFGKAYFELADPEEDYEDLRPSILKYAQEQNGVPDYSLNAFGERASLSYDEWFENGWIFPEDPLGWFHWYCRFISGRRHERDLHQVNRWLAYSRWHTRAVNMKKKNGRVSNVINQGLLHWSWEVVV